MGNYPIFNGSKCNWCGIVLDWKKAGQKFCSLKCFGDFRVGSTREDCRVYKTCPKCESVGFGLTFWNSCREMCNECAKTTKRKYPATNEKNRKYKTCRCGFVGYGIRQFPYEAKGLCVICWRKITGYAVHVEVKDEWDSWANVKGNAFFRRQRKIEARQNDKWLKWSLTKQCILINKRKVSRLSAAKVKMLGGFNWNGCFDTQLYKLSQQAKDQGMNQWDRKVCFWGRSLTTRSRTSVALQVEPSCED